MQYLLAVMSAERERQLSQSEKDACVHCMAAVMAVVADQKKKSDG
jgi:hypothetical protein